MSDSDTVDPSFDSPDSDEVLQEDEQPMEAVPVIVNNVVRMDKMPSRRAVFRNIVLRAGTDAQKVVNDNPRRSRLVMWPSLNLDAENTIVCIAESFADAQSFSGALLQPGTSFIPLLNTEYSGEVFARPCILVDSGGVLDQDGITVSTDDIFLSVLEEEWAT